MRHFIAIVPIASLLSTAVPAVAQGEAAQLFHLADGSTIRHDRYDGVLRRIDNAGRQVARVNLPRAQVIEKHTDVVVSSHETRLLVVHRGSTNRYPPGHLVMILDAMSLKRVAEFPLGDCGFVDVSARPDDVTLLCHQSQDPANKKGKKTFALATLDLNRATLVRWFNLGGERRGQWVGPMFFGYYDDEWPIHVGTEGCSAFTDSAHSVVETVDLHEQPEHVIVIARRDSATKGEVWFVSSRAADVPRMVFTFANTPTKATRCGDVLYVTEEAPSQTAPSR